MAYGIIYVITNTVNGKQYVGQTKHSLSCRWWWHKRYAEKGSKLALHAAIRKYGSDSFTRAKIAESFSQDDANDKEILFISQLGTFTPSGYNLTLGGNQAECSLETRRKLSEINLGRRHTEQSREKMSKASRERKRKPHSEETKKKISDGNKRRPKKEFCKRGHAFDEKNTYLRRPGKRVCRACWFLLSGYHLPE
jgi:group I intron endonuclease